MFKGENTSIYSPLEYKLISLFYYTRVWIGKALAVMESRDFTECNGPIILRCMNYKDKYGIKLIYE